MPNLVQVGINVFGFANLLRRTDQGMGLAIVENVSGLVLAKQRQCPFGVDVTLNLFDFATHTPQPLTKVVFAVSGSRHSEYGSGPQLVWIRCLSCEHTSRLHVCCVTVTCTHNSYKCVVLTCTHNLRAIIGFIAIQSPSVR